MIRFGSVCSGIEAASVAWHPLGWRAAFLSEIEAFPRAVLKHHYPDVPLHGDFTTIEAGEYEPIDLLVGGTPCQDFSVAGLRAGMAGDRGNLTLQFLTLARRLRPLWLVWENVPGVLSSNGGRDFGAFLGGLGELGYGWAYRTLDAQHLGVPQRRRRVFVVGYLGDWRRAAAVLFERHSLSGNPPPRREAGERVARCLATGTNGQRYDGESETFICDTLTVGANQTSGFIGEAVAHSLRGDGFDASEDGTGRGTPLVPVAFSAKDCGADAGETAPTLRAGAHRHSHANAGVMPAIAFQHKASAHNSMNPSAVSPPLDVGKSDGVCVAFMENQRGELRVSGQTDAMAAGGGKPGQGYPAAMQGMAVRRLTPRECERLQGFPDDYTFVPYRGKPAADGPRYKALGNSMAVPVMRWLGERLSLIHALQRAEAAA